MITTGTRDVGDAIGPRRFARFATPPNQLGYCGPSTAGGLAPYLDEPVDDGMRELATRFEGAYPYLRLLAGAHGCDDPLDPDVVEAYWIGNHLLDDVTTFDFGNSIDTRFRRRAGAAWHHIDESIPAGVAHHSYHVLHVMPWAGLLQTGIVDEPLRIIDQCCVTWGRVVETGAVTLVSRRPLVWSGSALELGPATIESVTSTIVVEVGDRVALHWGAVCERLDPRQLAWLQRTTLDQLHTFAAG